MIGRAADGAIHLVAREGKPLGARLGVVTELPTLGAAAAGGTGVVGVLGDGAAPPAGEEGALGGAVRVGGAFDTEELVVLETAEVFVADVQVEVFVSGCCGL